MTPVIGRLKTRPEFLRAAAAGRKWAAPGLVLQGRSRRADRTGDDTAEDDAAEQEIRFGLTASRKVGGAVVRNRARRRLRAVASEVLPAAGSAGWDYVLIARAGTLRRPYRDLVGDLRLAIERVARRTPKSGAHPGPVGKPRRPARRR